jgi:hypothetical protein
MSDIKKFDKETFEELKNAKGEKNKVMGGLVTLKWSNIVPTSWNHFKKEYVAIIKCCSEDFDGLEREFISDRTNFSSSGKNADLETVEPTEENILIEIKTGSHKSMTKTIYRRENGLWIPIAGREGRGNYFGGGNTTGWKIFN